jgi:phage-related protein
MIIGHAEIIVSPITKGFESSLRRDLANISGIVNARGAGQSMGDAFSAGFDSSTRGNIFGKFADGLRSMVPEAEMARKRFQTLVRVGYVLQGIIGPLIGGISSLVVSLGTLVGILGKAAPAVAVLANAFTLLRVTMATVKFGFGDIASAVRQATEPTGQLGKSLAELREEFQQLTFDAEQANQSEARAALNLEDALNNLKRVQDLPPNSRARREAQLAYEEADLAYRRAKDRAADLNEEVSKGQEEFIKKNQQAAGTDPFAGLNKAQREFAEYLVTLKPLIDDLELRVSNALIPPLQDATEILVRDLLPILRQRLPQIAGQAGQAIEDLVNSIDYEQIDRIFRGFTEPFEEGGRSNLQLFGDLLNNILTIFLDIVEATGPLLTDLLEFLVQKTQDWIDTTDQGELRKFFEEAGEVAGDLGEILGNVFEGLGNLIGLTTGPGSAGNDMLDWMKKSTETFANMFSEDPEAGKQFFKDAFANARSVLSSIGALLMEIFKLADNPNIGKTFKTLKEGAPALGEMLGKMIDAGPSFAEFLKTVTEISNELTDSAQISAFFDTLNAGAGIFLDFVRSESFKRILDNLGPIFASLSAVGVLFDVLRFGFQVLIGYLAFIALGGSRIKTIFSKATDNVKALFTKKLPPGQLGPLTQAQTVQQGMLTKFGKLAKGAGIVGLIIFVITKMVEFYDKFVDFRATVDETLAGVKDAFARFMEPLSEIFEKIFGGENGGGILSALDPVIKVILERLIPILGFVIEAVLNVLTLIADVINTVLGGLLPAFEDVGSALGKLFEGDILGFLGDIGSAILNLGAGIIQSIGNIFIDILNFVIRGINSMIGLITKGPLGDFMRDVFGIDISGYEIPELGKIDILGDAARARERNRISNALGAGATTSYGGADRLAVSSAVSSNASVYATARMQGMPEYAEFQAGTTVNITNNINGDKMDSREVAKGVSRELGFQLRNGVITG